MKKITKNYSIKASPKQIWQALVDPKVIESWGGGPAKMEATEGYRFSLWGGDIFGKNLIVLEQKKLVQEWYGGKWDQPSIVTFSMVKEGDKVNIELIHEDIPDHEVEEIEKGWNEYYLGKIKGLFEK